MGENERMWINKYRFTENCINVLDGDIVETKKAREEFDAEKLMHAKKHDAYVRDRKNELTIERDDIIASMSDTLNLIDRVRASIYANENFIKDNGGIFLIFKSKLIRGLVESTQKSLASSKLTLAKLEASLSPAREKIRLLNKEIENLKSTKQMENSQKVLRRKLDRIAVNCGLNINSRRNKNKIH